MEHAKNVCYDIIIEQEARLLKKFQNEYGMTVTYPDKNKLKASIEHLYHEIEQEIGEGSISTLMNIE